MQEIIINKDNANIKTIAIVENGILIEKYEEVDNKNRLEGNIYLGKIQNVFPGMQAAFVNIGENKNAFIHLKDILPKVDTKIVNTQLNEVKNIKDVVKPGMPILVQVKRDASYKKGGRVSTHISISGRFVVFMPNADFITISQKINDERERKRLKDIISKLIPTGCGAIIRTSAEKKDEKELKLDIENLISKWEKIQKQSEDEKSNLPRLIYKNENLIEKLFIDVIDQNIDKITVNNKEIYNNIKQMLEEMNLINKININIIEKENILDIYELNVQIDKLKNNKIWLKCGGFITIDKTEALTAIDVNTGKYTGSKDLEETVYTVNKEATIEIAKQLKLRDISGIIIIDYIDMQLDENKQKIRELLIENLKKDRSKTQVLEFTKLNLLEMTRKHICS